MTKRRDALFSFDVETDGATPSIHSMSSVGAVLMGFDDGRSVEEADVVNQAGFYAELKPVTDTWDPEALKVGGLDRSQLLRSGEDPRIAMRRLCVWIEEQADGARPVFFAYPASFDWRWTAHYLEVYGGTNPFGFSGVLDLKSILKAHLGLPLSQSTKRNMPVSFRSGLPHTHNALDDAREQAVTGLKVLKAVNAAA